MNRTRLDAAMAADGIPPVPTDDRATKLLSHHLGSAAAAVWSNMHIRTDVDDQQRTEHIYPQRVPSHAADRVAETGVSYARDLFAEVLQSVALMHLFQPTPRVHVTRNLVSQFWSSQMLRARGVFPDTPKLDVDEVLGGGQVAGVVLVQPRGGGVATPPLHPRVFLDEIRRLERARGEPFAALYLVSDDPTEVDRLTALSQRTMNHTAEMSTDEELQAAYATNDDDAITRAVLKGRWLLHNHLAPAACIDPASPQGAESLLVSVSFLIHHACATVGHAQASVARFLQHANRAREQRRQKSQEAAYVKRAPHVSIAGDTAKD